MNEYNPQGKDIRFIDSHYKDLFKLPDGGTIQIAYPDETVVKKCTFIDEYHTQIGYNVFHICQFAEIMERNNATYQPEPEICGDEAAWKVGRDRYLAIQICDDGYDYTLLNDDFAEIDGGQIDDPDLSMLEVRADILDSFGLSNRELKATDYENLMEKMYQTSRQEVEKSLKSALEKPDVAKRESVLTQLNNVDMPEKTKPIKHSAPER